MLEVEDKNDFYIKCKLVLLEGKNRGILRGKSPTIGETGYSLTTYGVFLPKHRKGNPGGCTEYFLRNDDGSYSLIPKFLEDP